ncbi:hypothetical protein OQA88_5210 [Cercophora sp. LCS_1]
MAITIPISLPAIAKTIDHSLLHPTMTDADVTSGLEIARKYNVAAACIKPYHIPLARQILAGSDVKICAVIGFPHGNSTTSIKVAEAKEAVQSGAHEIDMVVNIGKVLSSDWEYVRDEIAAINTAVTTTLVGGRAGETAILKVIFENDFLQDEHIIDLCRICSEVGVAFVKTSTGYGFVKQENGMYSYKGATMEHVALMRGHIGPDVEVKAAGGVRTLDELLLFMSLGVTRIGATATVAIIEEASARGVTEVEAPFSFSY